VADDEAQALDISVISVAELQAAVARLLEATASKVRRRPRTERRSLLDHKVEDSFDLTKTPEIMVGQLSDDLSEVRALLARDEEDVSLWRDLEHVIGVLRRIASLDLS
jgi:hypothetical protein